METKKFDVLQLLAPKLDAQERLDNPVPDVSAGKVEGLYGLPVDTAVAFSNHKGIYKPGIEKRQRKLLRKLTFLTPFLAGGERILQVTLGCSPASFVEQLLTGALLHPLKRALFVVTDRRILHIPVTHRLLYRYSISQIMFVDCRQIRFSGSTLIIKYKSGHNERFRCISRRGRRKFKSILRSMSLEGRASPALERTNLCPRCMQPLIKRFYTCPNCSLKFKSKAWATLISIVFPGGGYFYIRHPFLGVLEAATEILFAALLVFFSTIVWKNLKDAPDALFQAVVICAIMLVYQKLASVLFTSKCIDEFIPKKHSIAVQKGNIPADGLSPNPDEMHSVGWRCR
jgi:hypothetical protein